MGNLDANFKMLKAHKIFRLITTIFAILGPITMICSAIVITLCEGDWWFNLFAAYLAGILMIAGTLYLSLLALMSEITRHFAHEIKRNFSGTPFTKWIHRLLTGCSIAGVLSYIPFIFILCDVLNGGFAIIHFICGGAIVVLYIALGTNTVVHRKNRLED